MTRAVRLRVAYDGTDFRGWQRQDGPAGSGARSVQGCLEAALARMHKRPVAAAGAGRTDSGVHAAGQVASFGTDIAGMDAARFAPALNGLLPRDVRVVEAREVSPGFHARLDASSRTYRYHFVCGRQALPHEGRYALWVRRRPRVALLNAYCRLLLGERDFSAFASAGDPSLSRFRHVSRAFFFPAGDSLVFEISANAFLWKMVRSVAGTLMRCEERSDRPEALRDVIASGDRSLAGPTLPARGLFLWGVGYHRG